MKVLKLEDYQGKISTLEDTKRFFCELQSELEKDSAVSHIACDRIIRACSKRLESSGLNHEFIQLLVRLVELSLGGFDSVAVQKTPLYIEKVLYHVLRSLCQLEDYETCIHFAATLCTRLSANEAGFQRTVVLSSCHGVLWNAPILKTLNHKDHLKFRMQALGFLLLDNATDSPVSRVSRYALEAVEQFQGDSEKISKDDACFLLQEIQILVDKCRENTSTLKPVFSSVNIALVKLLCQGGHYDLASTFFSQARAAYCHDVILKFCKWSLLVYTQLSKKISCARVLKDCMTVWNDTATDPKAEDVKAFLDGSSLLAWAVDSHSKEEALSAPDLLAYLEFLREQQEWMLQVMTKDLGSQAESLRLQQVLCKTIRQMFTQSLKSLEENQLKEADVALSVVDGCRKAATLIRTKNTDDASVYPMAKALFKLAYGFFQQNHFSEVYKLLGEFSFVVDKKTYPVELINWHFSIVVSSCRRIQKLEEGSQFVGLWLKALGDKVLAHSSAPLTARIKIKAEASLTGDKKIVNRKLHEEFGDAVPNEKVMLKLLDENLQKCKDCVSDMSAEIHNTLDELLLICHDGSQHMYLRAVYLTDMAELMCSRSFRDGIDCTHYACNAMDLLKKKPASVSSTEWYDVRARAFLWHFISSLRKRLMQNRQQEGEEVNVEDSQSAARAFATSFDTMAAMASTATNDFELEEIKTTQDTIQIYDGLCFDLASAEELCKPLKTALLEWSTLLENGDPSHVRNTKETFTSITTLAALFRLMAKPLEALKTATLCTKYARKCNDNSACANSLCQSAEILLDLGTPELALMQIEEAEKLLDTQVSCLSLLVILLKSQYCYSTGEVTDGVKHLCMVLNELGSLKYSKTSILLRARALQICSSYLLLDSTELPEEKRAQITQHGIKNPDTAQHESHKLLTCLVYTVLGPGFYGSAPTTDTPLAGISTGGPVVWQMLFDLLRSAMKTVTLRTTCGTIRDARGHCVEALRLAARLQAAGVCAELLVMKAELDLLQGDKDESKMDLEKVRQLLESCIDINLEVPPEISYGSEEADEESLIKTKCPHKEVITTDLCGSPVLKCTPQRLLLSLEHDSNCLCPCCSDPCLGRATVHWAAAKADLMLQQDPREAKTCLRLLVKAMDRCTSVSTKLSANLAKLFPCNTLPKKSLESSMMVDLMGHLYLRMSMSGFQPEASRVFNVWEAIEAGLAFVAASSSLVLGPVKANLMAIKAIATLVAIANKKRCSPEDLLSDAWSWKVPALPHCDMSSASTEEESMETVADVKKIRPKTPKVESKVVPETPRRKMTRAVARKLGIHFSDSGMEIVPNAPKRPKRTRFVVQFSDDSDDETEISNKAVARSSKGHPSTSQERPSIKSLGGPSTQTPDFEVWRKDISFRVQSTDWSEVTRGHLQTGPSPHPHFSPSSQTSLADIKSVLASCWLSLQHCPPAPFFTNISTILALILGQNAPKTTAMLHLQSVGITSRHCNVRHVDSTLKKLEKTVKPDDANQSEGPGTQPMFKELEKIFAFSTAEMPRYPHAHQQEMIQQIQQLPEGTSVCLLSLIALKPSEISNSIMLTRLEKDCEPLTVHIDTSKFKDQKPISHLLMEIENIHKEQKQVMCFSSKEMWWKGRRDLDARVTNLLTDMEKVLGCWLSLLHPTLLDPALTKVATKLHKVISEKGVPVTVEMFKVLLSAARCITEKDCQTFGRGLSPNWDLDCEQHLCAALKRIRESHASFGHMVLILDKHLQKLPWESTPHLIECSMTRMPSVHSLIALCIQKRYDLSSVSQQGVNLKKVFYVLDPDGNLESSNEQFKDWFADREWEGVVGSAPGSKQLAQAVSKNDLYIYVGHGAGSRFLDSNTVLKVYMRAAALLFGCSSCALLTRGDQEGHGIVLSYLMAGCPFILGNLWDVTDRDIDRFTRSLLESWLEAPSGTSLLEFIGPSRRATFLKSLIGAAPVVYGLPVYLQ